MWWKSEDEKWQFLLHYYEEQEAAAQAKAEAEAAEDYEIRITSEVKVK